MFCTMDQTLDSAATKSAMTRVRHKKCSCIVALASASDISVHDGVTDDEEQNGSGVDCRTA